MEELVTCEGTVHSVIFQNAENGYTVLRLLTEEGEVITVVGCIPCVAPGEHLAVSGTWELHPARGAAACRGAGAEPAGGRGGDRQLPLLRRVQGGGARHRPADRGPVRHRHAGHPGAGAGAAHRPQGRHRQKGPGDRRELPPPHGAAAADGVPGPVRAAAILAMELRRQYGDAALEKVRENPYLLSGESCGVAFSVTDRMAHGHGPLRREPAAPPGGGDLRAAAQREQRPCVPAPEQADRPPPPSCWTVGAIWWSRPWTV